MKRDEKGRFTTSKQERKTNEEKVYATGFKGFEKGMICRGKQYAENTVFEEPEAELCERGMHFCENPLDVLEYYPLLNDDGQPNEFASVESLHEHKTDGNKSVTTKLRIGAKINLAGLVKAAVEFSLAWVKKVDFHSAASGDWSQLAASGDRSQLAASGDRSQLAASGDRSQLAASGDRSQLAASGYRSQLAASGKECVVASTGINGQVKGALGCFIACAEWKKGENCEWHPVAFVSTKVDGKKIKSDTWYTVKNGKFVEAE